MISLVQVLIAAVLIPVSFGAPAADDSEPTSTIRPLAFVTAIPTYLLSHNGTCGEGTDYMCEVGICCSKYGVCGTTKDHCGAGCQSKFGSCDPTGLVKYRESLHDGRCGRGINIHCDPKKCCSQRGYCGYTKQHCGFGCQSAFGLCDSTDPTGPLQGINKVLCGRQYNYKCPPDFCCSQHGFCEQTRDDCGIDCQEAFGVCDPRPDVEPLKVSKDARCGKGTEFGCNPGNCCSDHGFCGATSDYCGAGCQADIGLCDPPLLVSQPSG